MTDRAWKLGAVLLAAGPSTRLGQPKQLVRVGGEALARRAARLLTEAGVDEVLVVTGCQGERVEEELQGLPVQVVRNRDWSLGMGSSINSGARAMPPEVGGVLVMACDQWRLEAADLEALIAAWSSDISRIYLACWDEGKAFVSGPPVIFPGKLIPELKSMLENRGARQLVDRYMDIVEFVKLPNAAFDLDRPEDLEKLQG